MKKFLSLVLMVFAFFAFSNSASAQSKIGYISTQDLISVMPETRNADSVLRQYNTALYNSAR